MRGSTVYATINAYSVLLTLIEVCDTQHDVTISQDMIAIYDAIPSHVFLRHPRYCILTIIMRRRACMGMRCQCE